MPNTLSSRRETRVVIATFGFVVVLYLAWAGAWMLVTMLGEYVGWPTTNDARTFYWIALKVILWILPAILIFRYSCIEIGEAIRGDGIRSILLWGVGAGVLIGVELVIRKWLGQQSYSFSFSWTMVNVVLISPIVEEFVFRGAVLGSLLKQYRFGIANVIASLLFVGAHVPGWYFTGALIENLTRPSGGAFSIFVLGLIFGFVVWKTRSVAGGMIAHGINNFFSVL